MHSNTPPSSARRTRRRADRRSHNRRTIVATGLAFGIVTAVAFTATAPSAQAEAGGTAPRFVLASYSTPLKATVTPAATEESAADAAVAAAETVTTAAAAVQADIVASGLDIGEPDTSVDTAALDAAAARLDAADVLPAPLVPALTEDVTELVASVDSRVNQLRGSLDGAVAKKAEEEAAEKARLEAEAAQAAAAAAAEAAAAEAAPSAPSAPRSSGSSGSSSAPTAPIPSGGGGGDNSPEGAKATAYGMVTARGWGDDQYSCLVSLWDKESGWNYRASNPSSGAYGIPQALPGSKMSSAGADWQTNAATQISWGLGYISGRYGDPCGAWSHSQSVGWY